MRLRTLTGLINLEMLAYGYMELLLQLTTYNNNSTVHLDVLQWWLYQNFSTLIDLLCSIAEFQLMRSNHDVKHGNESCWFMDLTFSIRLCLFITISGRNFYWITSPHHL